MKAPELIDPCVGCDDQMLGNACVGRGGRYVCHEHMFYIKELTARMLEDHLSKGPALVVNGAAVVGFDPASKDGDHSAAVVRRKGMSGPEFYYDKDVGPMIRKFLEGQIEEEEKSRKRSLFRLTEEKFMKNVAVVCNTIQGIMRKNKIKPEDMDIRPCFDHCKERK